MSSVWPCGGDYNFCGQTTYAVDIFAVFTKWTIAGFTFLFFKCLSLTLWCSYFLITFLRSFVPMLYFFFRYLFGIKNMYTNMFASLARGSCARHLPAVYRIEQFSCWKIVYVCWYNGTLLNDLDCMRPRVNFKSASLGERLLARAM